ncbi:MAG: glycosyltransferase family 39 protein [Stigonema ocellatum SAG 48.90 = DSM 106950]|nr:glycosyltransferase family 39 protein [Stigonema ocellatum SAG 48.90 = DSM 106950]
MSIKLAMIKKTNSISWFKLLVVIVLILGIFFRFFNIDHKFYWFDETFTSLRVSGYTESEVVKQLCNGQELSVEDLQKYQRLGTGKTLIDTIKSLALEDPQHPPLYFSIAHFWVYWFGNSIATIRSLSAIISLMVFPCLYWLCLELFESSIVGLVAVTLIAVSPIHVLFAQEAREYSLWTLTTLLSSVSLLRAMRLNTKFSWSFYAISLALSFYTFIFSGLVTIGHFIYVAITEKWQTSKRFINYILASLFGILIFAPWIIVIISSFSKLEETTEWITKMNYTLPFLIERWLLNYSRVFIDIGSDVAQPLISLLVLIILGYSIYFICQRTPEKVWLFVVTLIGTLGLTLMVADIITGGVFSVVPRYLFPSYLGFHLAVAYWISAQITAASLRKKRLGKIVLTVLTYSGIISCIIISQADIWWLKGGSFKEPVIPQIARIINQATNPLVISSCQGIWPVNDKLSLSHLLAPRVQLQLVIPPNIPRISPTFNHIFLFNASQELQALLEKEENLKPTFRTSN